jgi:hypothetical protein
MRLSLLLQRWRKQVPHLVPHSFPYRAKQLVRCLQDVICRRHRLSHLSSFGSRGDFWRRARLPVMAGVVVADAHSQRWPTKARNRECHDTTTAQAQGAPLNYKHDYQIGNQRRNAGLIISCKYEELWKRTHTHT